MCASRQNTLPFSLLGTASRVLEAHEVGLQNFSFTVLFNHRADTYFLGPETFSWDITQLCTTTSTTTTTDVCYADARGQLPTGRFLIGGMTVIYSYIPAKGSGGRRGGGGPRSLGRLAASVSAVEAPLDQGSTGSLPDARSYR